jgi:ribonuclease Z
MPSPERGVSAVALQIGKEVLLFDCGEGTQRQFMRSNVSFMKITHIFISHFHGDHILGLPGLVQSMNFSGREKDLYIFGPEGMIDLAHSMLSFGYFQPSFKIFAGEMKDGDAIDLGKMTVMAVAGEHSVPALSFVVEEKGKKGKFLTDKAKELGVPPGPLFSQLQAGEAVTLAGKTIKPEMVLGPPRSGRKVVISGDTRPNPRLTDAARGADVLVHEATLDSTLAEGAKEYGHSTAREAGEVAMSANVELLVLTHISNRYADPSILVDEAKEYFPHTIAAYDLLTIPVKLKH